MSPLPSPSPEDLVPGGRSEQPSERAERVTRGITNIPIPLGQERALTLVELKPVPTPVSEMGSDIPSDLTNFSEESGGWAWISLGTCPRALLICGPVSFYHHTPDTCPWGGQRTSCDLSNVSKHLAVNSGMAP